MTKKQNRKRGFGRRSLSVVLSVLMILSTLVVMLSASSLSSSAAASSTLSGGESINIYLQDSNWQCSSSDTVRVRFLNSSGSVIGTSTQTPVDGKITVTGVSGATKLKLEKVNATKSTYLSKMQSVVSGAGSTQTVVFYDNTSTQWSDMKYYAWTKSGTATYEDQPWVSRNPMTLVSGTTYLYYAKINRNANLSAAYQNIIFTGSDKQTADLTLNGSTSSTIQVYTSAQNRWITYTDVDVTLTANVSDRKENNLNDLYVTGKTTAKWSKYNASTPKTTVYFKPNSSSWTTAWVHYDDSDDEPYYTSVQMTQYSASPLIYQADVYFGAMVSFSTGQNFDSSDRKDQGSVYADADEPVYVAKDRSWTTLDNALATEDRYSDFTVSNNNFASITPTGGGKVVGFEATYYDYYSNNELTQGWRNGLVDDNFSDGYRKQFSSLNDAVIGIAKSNTDWRYPMVFGDDYNASYFIDGYYNQISSGRGIDLDHFRAVNNSNFLDTGNELDRSIMGLVKNKLTGGDLMVTDSLKAPYFDNDWLSGNGETSTTEQKEVLYVLDNNNYGQNGIYANFWGGGDVLKDIHPEWVANNVNISGTTGTLYRYVVDKKFTSVQLANSTNYGSHFYEYMANGSWVLSLESGVVKTSGGTVSSSTYRSGIQDVTTTPTKRATIIDSKFPFVETTDSSGVKHYVFNSGQDGTRKDNIAFSFDDSNPSNSTLNYYSGNGVVGKLDNNNGFFPFNSTSNSYPRNYGFGMRVDMDFTLPENGKFEDGSKAKFEYSGDDDVWVFVDGNLILDIGGAHRPTTGSIDFGYASGQISAKTDKVCSQLLGQNQDTWDGGASKTKTFSFNNTDPTKKHHMTVFYMERGTNDSNLKIEFSIQPVLNELDVYKEVETEELNAGIEDTVLDLAQSSDFGFTFKQDGSGYGGSAGKKFNYVHADDTTTTSTIKNGSFSLKHYEEAMFNNDLELTYGSTINLSESKPSLFTYDTDIEVTDILNGEAVLSAFGSTSAAFDFKNKANDGYGDPEQRTLLFAEFINTLQTSSIRLHKDLYKQDSEEISEDMIAFEFKVELDLDCDGTWETYDLEYQFDGDTSTYVAEDGVVQMRQDQEIEFIGIPVGTPYRITESDLAGYLIMENECEDTTGAVGDGGAMVLFVNEEAPANGALSMFKTLDGEMYSGSDFSFTIQLIEWNYGEGRDYKVDEYSDMLEGIYATNTATTVTNGEIDFDPFTITPSNEHVGLYVFKITESDLSGSQPWFSYDDSVYYAAVRVDAGSMDDPVFYTDEACTEAVVGTPSFVNTSRRGKITIQKEDVNGDPLNDTRFAVLKVSSEDEVDEYLTPDVINEIVGNYLVEFDDTVMLETTGANGKAIFDDLPLYQEEGQFVYNPTSHKIEWSTDVIPTAKQTYCVFEYSPKDGYAANYTKGYIILADQPDCSWTFGVVNGVIKNPSTAGWGWKALQYAGIGIIALSGLMLLAYVLYFRKKKAYVPAHLRK